MLALAAELQGAAGLPVRAPLVGSRGRRRSPLSYAQRRLWFLDRLEGAVSGRAGGSAASSSAQNSSAYVIPLAVRLEGVLDRGALIGALHDLVGRHESLRTVFPERSGCRGSRSLRRLRRGFALRSQRSMKPRLPAALIGRGVAGLRSVAELPLRAHLFEVAA